MADYDLISPRLEKERNAAVAAVGALLASTATDALHGLELGDRTLDRADASLILLRLMAKGFRITRA